MRGDDQLGEPPDRFLDDLDTDQRRAVSAESHLVAVIAGAGSGKTRVLTRRVAYRIATGSAAARHTLVLTFTREAAGELRRRLNRSGIRERVEAGTFHSVMIGVLKQRWADTDRRPKTVVADRRRLVADALDLSARRHLDAVLAEINWATARGVSANAYASTVRRLNRRPQLGVEQCAAALEAYETLKRRRGVIDFDDVLSFTIRELRRDLDFADSLRWRFRHLLVDESQDLNPLQHQLVDILREGRDDLFLVGDPSQAIYGFNGADPALLIDVEEHFPGIEIIRLPVNHRCTPQIVDAGLRVLAASEQPTLLASSRPDGVGVTTLVADDDAAEASLIARFVATDDPTLVRAGQVAVLVRTNAQVDPIRSALVVEGVAVRRRQTATGSPLQLLVRQVAACGSSSQLRAWAHDVLDAPSNEELSVNRPRSRADLRLVSPADELDRRVALAVLEYLREAPVGDGAGFRAWVATRNPFDDGLSEGVEILTFHAAKGREWHTVVVAGVESGLVPHKSASTSVARAEEGRLLYVAFTRATDRLVVSRAERRGGYARTASPFMLEVTVGDPPVSAPPRRRRMSVGDPLLTSLREWRAQWARTLDVLPTELCNDRDLSAIARHRPTTPEELADVTSFGLITARRLAPQIVPLVATSPGRS